MDLFFNYYQRYFSYSLDKIYIIFYKNQHKLHNLNNKEKMITNFTLICSQQKSIDINT